MTRTSADSQRPIHDVLELAELVRPTWPRVTADLRTARVPLCLDEPPDTMARVRELNQQISQARETAGARWHVFEQARQALAASSDATNTNSELFRAAEQASTAYTAAADQVRTLDQTRERLMGIGTVGAPAAGSNGPQDGDRRGGAPNFSSHVDHDQLQALTTTPGAVMATMLERRKRQIPQLPSHLSGQPMSAALSQITTSEVSSTTESAAVIDLLAPSSVALASGIQVLRIDTTKTKVPRFTDLPVANWIPELGLFPKSGPGIEMVDVEPPKVGLITPLSLEVFEDLRPITLAMLQVQMLRAVALAFDRGILFGDGTGASPLGVANTPGIAVVPGLDLYNLGAFAEAIATLIAGNARAGALVMNPLDIGTLLKLTESEGGAGSNIPLWKASINSASGLRLPFFDVPIWPTPAAPRGTALLYDAETIIAVIRRELDLAVDPYYDFDRGNIGLRVYIRGDVVVGQGDGTVLILFGKPATGSAATDIITASGHSFSDGDELAFSDIVGGAPLVAGTTYFARDVSGATFKVAATSNGAAINLTTDLTAGRVRRV